MSLTRLMVCCLSGLCVLLVGCLGSSDPNEKPTKPVSVTVTYKGQRVEGALITFIDESGSDPASGRTNAQGVAQMTTYEQGDGAVYGTHKVTIVKTEVAEGPVADQDSEAYVPPEMQNAPPPEVKYHVPMKYSLPATSGLTATISEDSTEELKFDLTD